MNSVICMISAIVLHLALTDKSESIMQMSKVEELVKLTECLPNFVHKQLFNSTMRGKTRRRWSDTSAEWAASVVDSNSSVHSNVLSLSSQLSPPWSASRIEFPPDQKHLSSFLAGVSEYSHLVYDVFMQNPEEVALCQNLTDIYRKFCTENIAIIERRSSKKWKDNYDLNNLLDDSEDFGSSSCSSGRRTQVPGCSIT
jgi:hypothetical protein